MLGDVLPYSSTNIYDLWRPLPPPRYFPFHWKIPPTGRFPNWPYSYVVTGLNMSCWGSLMPQLNALSILHSQLCLHSPLYLTHSPLHLRVLQLRWEGSRNLPAMGRTIWSFIWGTSKVSQLLVMMSPFGKEIRAVTSPLREINVLSKFHMQLWECCLRRCPRWRAHLYNLGGPGYLCDSSGPQFSWL